MTAAARCLTVAITICAWIVLSNHCVFAAIAMKSQPTHSGCPFHSKPTKPQPQPAGIECCKILRAISTTPAKNLAPAIVDLLAVNLAVADLTVFALPKISFSPATLDTGPPGKTSLVELNGSARAHAPPFFS